jgi:sugar O-acyltransferase (sialic acid O-acetyltransferase NeuD family)
MKTKTWTIIGAGGLVNDIIDAIASRGEGTECIVLNMDINKEILEKVPAQVKVIELREFSPSTDFYVFGFVDPNKQSLIDDLRQFHLEYANLVHRHAYVPENVKMGKGNYIGPGAVLATYVELGNFNYINRSASIGHDSRILDFNEFGPGCTVAGKCHIGRYNHLYSGCVVINNIRLGDGITIGAGGVVIRDILQAGTYAGVPARELI